MNNIQKQYDETIRIFENVKDDILFDANNSDRSYTIKALYNNSIKIDFILKGLRLSEEIFYVSQILTRTLLEHYLVGYFIFIKSILDESDDVGLEYLREYMVSEYIKQQGYNLKVEKIKNISLNKSLIEFLKETMPDMEQVEQRDLDELHRIGNSFDVKNIGNYLVNHASVVTESMRALHGQMLSFLNRYNELSSYVHGGPIAEAKTLVEHDLQIKEKAIKENIDWGMIASKGSKINLLILLAKTLPKKYHKSAEMIRTHMLNSIT